MGCKNASYLQFLSLLFCCLLGPLNECLSMSAKYEIALSENRVLKTQGISNNVISGGQSTCMNGSITITGSTPNVSSGSYTYQWLISVNGNPTSFVPVSFNGNAKDYYPQGLTQNTWFRRIVIASGFPPDTSNSLGVYIKYVATWLGTIDSNWNNPANWADNMLPCPGNQIEVSINALRPLAVVNSQTISALYIAAGKSIIMDIPNTVLTIDNYNWGDGSIHATAGTVMYTSSTTQKIFDGTYNRLEINAPIATLGNVMIRDYISGSAILRTLGHLILDSGATHLIQAIQTEGLGRFTIKRIGPTGKSGPVLFPMYNNYLYLSNSGVTDDFTLYTADSICQTYNSSGIPTGPRITSGCVNKVWVIAENTSGGSNLNLNLNWKNNQEMSGFNRNLCYGVRHGFGWSGYLAGAASGASPFYSRSLSNVTSVGVFGIASNNMLPVELLEFTGKSSGETAILTWRTASEYNNREFKLERSLNNSDFETIASINGSENTKQERNYTYSDLGAGHMASTVYYRLVQVDLNGEETTYPIAVVSFNPQEPVLMSAYPNPAKDFVEVNLTNSVGALLSISDIAGRIIEQQTLAANNNLRINLQGMENGVYFIKVRTENGLEETIKLLKQD